MLAPGCRNNGPVASGRSRTSQSAAAGRLRHSTQAQRGRGSCGGTAGEAQVCVVLLAARGGLPKPKRRRTTSRLPGGNGQSGAIWPGCSHDAEQQTANDWPSTHGARWTMRHGWAPMLGHPWMLSWVFAGHGAMRCAKQRLGRRR